MPTKKRFLKSKPKVKVTFEVAKEAASNAEQIFLLGEFNDWQPVELQKFKNGKFKATVDIPTDIKGEFEYKYRVIKSDGSETFDNDWQADSYRENAFGTENSVLSVQA